MEKRQQIEQLITSYGDLFELKTIEGWTFFLDHKPTSKSYCICYIHNCNFIPSLMWFSINCVSCREKMEQEARTFRTFVRESLGSI